MYRFRTIQFRFTADAWLAIAIVALGIILRLGGIGAASLWHDEVLTYNDSQVPLARVVGWVRDHENCPPLYFVLINAWTKVFGAGDVSLRMPSALFAIATVILLLMFAKEWFGPTVAL